jgi:hypothetical protein
LLICIEGSVIAIGTLIAYWIDFGASYGKRTRTEWCRLNTSERASY